MRARAVLVALAGPLAAPACSESFDDVTCQPYPAAGEDPRCARFWSAGGKGGGSGGAIAGGKGGGGGGKGGASGSVGGQGGSAVAGIGGVTSSGGGGASGASGTGGAGKGGSGSGNGGVGETSGGEAGTGGSAGTSVGGSGGACTDGTTRCFDDMHQQTCDAGVFGADVACPLGCDPDRCVTLVDFVIGSGFGCLRLSNGTVECLGEDSKGQLGNGTVGSMSGKASKVMGLSGVRSLCAGAAHACAVDEAGHVSCWGANDAGQCGTTAAIVASPSIVSGVSGALLVACGAAHTCVVDASGATTCWGDNTFGQLGVASPPMSSTPVAGPVFPPGTTLTLAYERSCATTPSGVVSCWGAQGFDPMTFSPNGVATVVPGATSATKVAIGETHGCLIETGGTIRCWGRDDEGELADGQASSGGDASSAKLVANLQLATSLCTGRRHSCAMTATGVYCWGDDGSGQCGDGQPVMAGRTIPTPASVAGADPTAGKLVCGDAVTCTLHPTTIECWGATPTGDVSTPAPLPF